MFFNSHPHKEDDQNNDVINDRIDFSTHILTRRMIVLFYQKSKEICFSTHILTRRMTIFSCVGVGFITFFNSHPHKEDDNRLYFISLIITFSTHILTRRMTILSEAMQDGLVFQLTSSQGG